MTLFYPGVEHAGSVFTQGKKMSVIVQSMRQDCGSTSEEAAQPNLCVSGKQCIAVLQSKKCLGWKAPPEISYFNPS